MRVGVVKPDWGPHGGFERLLDRLIVLLEADGHTVDRVPVEARFAPRPIWGRSDILEHWPRHPEYFHYLALGEDIRRLSLRRFDVVLATQPPTFVVDHPRVLALFYHQLRIFYDLAEGYVAQGSIDPDVHWAAVAEVRAFDREWVGGVSHWLAGSGECAARLGHYWEIPDERISLLHAPALTEVSRTPPRWSADGPVVCVSRHEWPKRTELLVAAGQLLGGHPIEFVGGGGRLATCRELDAHLRSHPELLDPDHPEAPAADRWGLEPSRIGGTRAAEPSASRVPARSDLRFLGEVSDARRNRAYARASVVVAPAHREDYGLTALEAMLWQRPVVVCSDGGGLVDLVRETGAGLVVEPTPHALAEGIERVRTDTELRTGLLEAARAVPFTFTWARARAELRSALEQL